MRFDYKNFVAACRAGECNSPKTLSPLYKMSRRGICRFYTQSRLSLQEHYDAIRRRVPATQYGRIRLSVDLAWRGSTGHFPAYRYHVGEFLNDEWLSSVDWHGNKFHRDHISHQAMSFWIAKKLANGGSPELTIGGKTLRDICVHQVMSSPACAYIRKYAEEMGLVIDGPKARRRFLWESLFDEALFLASMYHDIGYPWQFAQLVADQLGNSFPPAIPIQLGAEKIYQAYGNRLLFYPLRGYLSPSPAVPAVWLQTAAELLQSGLTTTHGVPGALAFLYLNDILRDCADSQHNSPAGAFAIEWASMAILMHDMQKIFKGDARSGPTPEHAQLRIAFQRDPLSFMLTLVDQIQDFERPDACFTPKDSKVALEYKTRCHAVAVGANSHSALEIRYYFDDRADYLKNLTKYKPEVQAEYFDSNLGFVDPTGSGITKILLSVHPERRT